jgi:HRD ubiquitin ligase complex, ER membrane component
MWRNENGDPMTVQERRSMILESIVQRKAVKSKNSGEIQLPHEFELNADREGNKEKLQSPLGDGTVRDHTILGGRKHNKGNILVESMRKWRFSSRGDKDDESISSTIYSPKSCAICMTSYKDGDDICWSRNDNCVHAFHLKCMMTWLMKHDDCPLCRCNFLKSEETHDDHDDSTP